MQPLNLLVLVIVTFFATKNIQFGATFNDMQWTSEKCVSEERKSKWKNSV